MTQNHPTSNQEALPPVEGKQQAIESLSDEEAEIASGGGISSAIRSIFKKKPTVEEERRAKFGPQGRFVTDAQGNTVFKKTDGTKISVPKM